MSTDSVLQGAAYSLPTTAANTILYQVDITAKFGTAERGGINCVGRGVDNKHPVSIAWRRKQLVHIRCIYNVQPHLIIATVRIEAGDCGDVPPGYRCVPNARVTRLGLAFSRRQSDNKRQCDDHILCDFVHSDGWSPTSVVESQCCLTLQALS